MTAITLSSRHEGRDDNALLDMMVHLEKDGALNKLWHTFGNCEAFASDCVCASNTEFEDSSLLPI